jgi:hypothetical protein
MPSKCLRPTLPYEPGRIPLARSLRFVGPCSDSVRGNRGTGGSDSRDRNRINEAAGSIRSVAERAISELCTEEDRIGQITSLIADIAGMPNVLASNATIEAARGGEAGRAFVASEMKKLASQTGKATQDISQQIAQILTPALRAARSGAAWRSRTWARRRRARDKRWQIIRRPGSRLGITA